MGFNLSIGQFNRELDEDGYEHVFVKEVYLDEAPADDVPTDHMNKRWPSYISWGDFMDAMGWEEEFLIPSHPGYVIIDQTFKSIVDAAYEKHKDAPEHGVRITWMKFWTDWALVNCAQPIFHNS